MDRSLEPRKCTSKGLVDIDFSFATNNNASPVISGASSTLRGTGLDYIESIAYSAVGILIVTLKLEARARYVVTQSAELADLNAADDGAYATIGAVQNEGSSTSKMTFKVYTRAATGAKTDYTGRRVSVRLVLKNSTVGV